jgi:hypothetical protein
MSFLLQEINEAQVIKMNKHLQVMLQRECQLNPRKKGSDLLHVSPSDIMPIPKADTALKRRGQNRGNTAILTSSPYFKE